MLSGRQDSKGEQRQEGWGHAGEHALEGQPARLSHHTGTEQCSERRAITAGRAQAPGRPWEGAGKLTVLGTAPVRSGSEPLWRSSGAGGTSGGGGEKDGGVWLPGGKEPQALAGGLGCGRLCR